MFAQLLWQCWSGQDWDFHHHRPCTGAVGPGENGGHSLHYQQDQAPEDEDGPNSGMIVCGGGRLNELQSILLRAWVTVFLLSCHTVYFGMIEKLSFVVFQEK